MARLAHVLLLMVFVAALAGCAGSNTPAVKAGATTAPTMVDSASGSSSILGQVLDDETRPITGVEILVALRGATNESARLSTDASGRFTVTSIAAGEYVVYARRLGYHDPAPKTVPVSEGEAANVTIIMTPLPQLEPFHSTTISSHNFTNSVCVVVQGDTAACGVQVYSGGGRPRPVAVDEATMGELQTFVMEAKWQSSVGACPGYFRTDVYSPEQAGLDNNFPSVNSNLWTDDNPYHWDNIPESFSSPTRLVIQREGDERAMLSPNRTELNDGTPILLSGKWQYTVEYYTDGGGQGQPVGIYCVVDQVVDAAATVFFIDPMPTDWSVWTT